MKFLYSTISSLLLGWSVLACGHEPIELIQDRSAILEDQRLVGNTRAQAKTRGTIRKLPQLYVYHADFRAAYHLEGYREDFTRFMASAVGSYRKERSMVDLDKLLERAKLAEGPNSDLETVDGYLTLDTLPARDLTIVLYTSDNCSDCDRVEQTLFEWLAEQRYDYNFLRVQVN